jgi:hopene-associated glycosyltransferase HpnB
VYSNHFNSFFLLLSTLCCIVWIYLLVFRGNFWLANQRIDLQEDNLERKPSITVIIPARNESDVLSLSLSSIFEQDYSGKIEITIIDDQSTDGTGNIAEEIGREYQQRRKLTIISGETLPRGWSGKLWAIEQGIRYAEKLGITPDYYLLTDADIRHDRANLRNLVIKAERENLALVSLMVLLRCQSFWEKLSIPAFVFFFAKLYPFPLVNKMESRVAAAAGGCILIRSDILKKIGGIGILKDALIDDCSLAQAVKSKGKKIWLGLTETTISLRAYPSLESIWDMVARTAFTQLNYSPLMLFGAVWGMLLVYLVPVVSFIWGIIVGQQLLIVLGLIPWLLMTIAYLPTVRLYRCSGLWALCLPAIAFLYTLMTIDSALRHWQGKGGAWKGRVYP